MAPAHWVAPPFQIATGYGMVAVFHSHILGGPMRHKLSLLCLFSATFAALPPWEAPATEKKTKAQTKEELIRSAESAAPRHIAREATVVTINPDGSMTTLREGTNAFTCIPDAPSSPGEDPMCADREAMKWLTSWVKKEPKPANREPGFIYMLKGGSDISATDPWATKTDKFITSPPHTMIVWPFDAKQLGLPVKPQKTGMWVMWADTPYAHLMINGNPFEGKIAQEMRH